MGKAQQEIFSSPTLSFFCVVVVGCCGNLTSSFARRCVGRFDFDFRQDFFLFFPPPKTAVNSHFYCTLHDAIEIMAERFTRSRRLSPTSSLVVCGMCVLPSFYFTSCSYIFLTTFTFIAFVVAICRPPSSSPYQRDRKRKRLIKFRSK